MSGSPRAGCLPRVGGALALDFANSVSGRGTARQIENLLDYEDLLRWAVFNEVLTAEAAENLTARSSADERAAAFAQTVRLRELLHRVFDPIARREPADAAALQELAEQGHAAWQGASLVPAGGRFAWRFPAPDRSAAALLQPIVRSALEVLTRHDLGRLKACPGLHCGWLFLDATKNASRVWCEMEVCGIRAKLRQRATVRAARKGASAAASGSATERSG